MPLRNMYAKPTRASHLAEAVSKIESATGAVARDVARAGKRQQKEAASPGVLSQVFSGLASCLIKGDWSRADKTVSYMLLRDDVVVRGANYRFEVERQRRLHQDWPYGACKQAVLDEIEKNCLPRERGHMVDTMQERYGDALRASDAYRALHAACAAVDKRVELAVCVGETVKDGSGRKCFDSFHDYHVDLQGQVMATPRLVVRVYLDQPYSASSHKPVASVAAVKPTGPAQP